MSNMARKPAIRLPTLREDRVIRKAAKTDPDARPLSAAQLKAMVPLRGRPKSPGRKTLVSIRYSPEVLAFFRATGEGWQSRMDGVLRNYVARHGRRA